MDNYAIDKLKWQSGGVVLRVLAVRQGPGFECSRVPKNKAWVLLPACIALKASAVSNRTFAIPRCPGLVSHLAVEGRPRSSFPCAYL